MGFRARLLIGILAVSATSTIVFALGIRKEVRERLTAQYEQRGEQLAAVIQEDLRRQADDVGRRLASLKMTILGDNRFRAAVHGDASRKRYLIDYAEGAMSLAGLSMLQVQDDAGRILTSGHFRNEYDRLEPELPSLLAAAPERTALFRARNPEGSFLALARSDTFRLAGRTYTIIGGVTAERALIAGLASGEELSLSLDYQGEVLWTDSRPPVWDSGGGAGEGDSPLEPYPAGERLVAEVPLAFIETAPAGGGRLGYAQLRVTHTLAPLGEMRRSIDIWFVAALASTAVLALLLATWLATRISRPLRALAQATSDLDLDRLDVEFESGRRDEVGTLSSVLAAMTRRLRASASRLVEAERRATIGDMARQVNHDIRNGLTPLRNVFRHLADVLRDEPGDLGAVFEERKGTIDSSITYLETLADKYARLTPTAGRARYEVNPVVQEVVQNAGAAGRGEFRVRLDDALPSVVGDALVLRRVLENLVGNAIDSLESPAGTVTVSTEKVNGGPLGIRITIEDSGCGMSDEELARAFDDFYTTKENGSGLGLSIVRRLVLDLNGSVRLESEGGRGTRVIVELPADASSDADNGGAT